MPDINRPRPKNRPRKPDSSPNKPGNTVIDEIYREQDAQDQDRPSLKKIEQRKERRLTKILFTIFVVLILIVAAAIAGFMTFNREKKFNERGVGIAVEVPADVPSGGQTTLTFTLTNDESVGIKNVELALAPPEGWSFVASSPAPVDELKSVWRLGSIGAGQDKVFRVTGSIVGEVGGVKTFNATVTYRPDNFNYNFSAQTSGSITISTSILGLELKGPTQATPNGPATYSFTYANTSDTTLTAVRLTATLPETFTATKFDPKPVEGTTTWNIDELKSRGSGKITIEGAFKGTAGAALEFKVVGELRRNAEYERQVESTIVVLLSDNTLSLKLAANKKTSDSVAAPGGTLAYTLDYQNKSDIELADVAISVTISGTGLNASSFADDDDASFKDGKATWDKKLIPQLAVVKPGMSGTIRFSVKVRSELNAAKGGPPGVSVQASAAIGGVPSVKSDLFLTKITTTATFVVDPRYYRDDGTQVGSGPLPPIVGSATTYRVYWRITNTTNELQDITVKAVVPAKVFWTGKNVSATAGAVTFDVATRIVSWTVNKLPAGVGIGSTPISAGFDLAITPDASEAGTMPVLLESQVLTAKDGYTGTAIEVKHDNSTTDLPSDSRASGKGAVVAS